MKSSGEKWIVWGVAGFLVVLTAVAIVGNATRDPNADTGSGLVTARAPEIGPDEWEAGNPNAAVSVIEYADYQCPACASYQPIVRQLIADYGDRVRFVFRHFPLYRVHPNAEIASQAVEAAGFQGRFLEMSDLLYEKQSEWATERTGTVVDRRFVGYAASLGIDVERFRRDIDSDAAVDKIKSDVAGGNAARVDHTPTFFVNFLQIENPRSYDEFRSIIEQALAS